MCIENHVAWFVRGAESLLGPQDLIENKTKNTIKRRKTGVLVTALLLYHICNCKALRLLLSSGGNEQKGRD